MAKMPYFRPGSDLAAFVEDGSRVCKKRHAIRYLYFCQSAIPYRAVGGFYYDLIHPLRKVCDGKCYAIVAALEFDLVAGHCFALHIYHYTTGGAAVGAVEAQESTVVGGVWLYPQAVFGARTNIAEQRGVGEGAIAVHIRDARVASRCRGRVIVVALSSPRLINSFASKSFAK